MKGRSVDERYKRRMASFLFSDRKNSAASGVGGDVKDVEKLLLDMHNDAKAMEKIEKANKYELDEAEKATVEAGKNC